MVAIIDYGAGNLFSVKNALDFIGAPNEITSCEKEIRMADEIILPGVGAFPDAMKKLNASGLAPVIIEQSKHKPLLGICLGMQLLFEASSEFKETVGLSLISGRTDKIKTDKKIPHMGYNSLEKAQQSPLLSDVSDGEYVYFVHSYMAYTLPENVAAYCDYGIKIPALVQSGNVFGAQFHPEKSGETGIRILRSFTRLV